MVPKELCQQQQTLSRTRSETSPMASWRPRRSDSAQRSRWTWRSSPRCCSWSSSGRRRMSWAKGTKSATAATQIQREARKARREGVRRRRKRPCVWWAIACLKTTTDWNSPPTKLASILRWTWRWAFYQHKEVRGRLFLFTFTGPRRSHCRWQEVLRDPQHVLRRLLEGGPPEVATQCQFFWARLAATRPRFHEIPVGAQRLRLQPRLLPNIGLPEEARRPLGSVWPNSFLQSGTVFMQPFMQMSCQQLFEVEENGKNSPLLLEEIPKIHKAGMLTQAHKTSRKGNEIACSC